MIRLVVWSVNRDGSALISKMMMKTVVDDEMRTNTNVRICSESQGVFKYLPV